MAPASGRGPDALQPLPVRSRSTSPTGAYCSSYDSVIILNPAPSREFGTHTFRTGLYDRLSVLMRVTCLASSLCARVVTERPCSMLNETFNNGSPVPCDVSWDRYARFFTAKGKPLLVDIPPSPGHAPRQGSSQHWSASLAAAGSLDPSLIVARQRTIVEPRNLEEDEWVQATASLRQGKPFLWPLRWHEADRGKPSHLPVRQETLLAISRAYGGASRPVYADYGRGGEGSTRQLHAAFARSLKLVPGEYLSLHVRRGDAKGECDTRVDRVLSYVECMLGNEGLLESDAPLLLFTDERDPRYLGLLLSGLRRLRRLSGGHGQRGRSRRVYHGDRRLEELSRTMHSAGGNTDEDNFRVFNAAAWVQQDALAAYEMRDPSHSNGGLGGGAAAQNASTACGVCSRLADRAPRKPPSGGLRPAREQWDCWGAYGKGVGYHRP
jgi:hypothetical protein